MDFMNKLVTTLVFWFKYSLLIGVLFFTSWFGVAIFDSTNFAIDMVVKGGQYKYSAIMGILVYIGVLWALWSAAYVPMRHFVWGYPYMVSVCCSCDSEYGYDKCPKCGKGKFLDNQCMQCGHMFEGDYMKSDDCGHEGLIVKARRSFEFEDEDE